MLENYLASCAAVPVPRPTAVRERSGRAWRAARRVALVGCHTGTKGSRHRLAGPYRPKASGHAGATHHDQ